MDAPFGAMLFMNVRSVMLLLWQEAYHSAPPFVALLLMNVEFLK